MGHTAAALPVLPYRFWNVIRNCGDAITAYVIKNAIRLEPTFSSADDEHVLATGSIFFMANSHSWIWGSGVLNPTKSVAKVNPRKVCAVRGHKTLAHLRQAGLKIGDVPLGDPGILVDGLLGDDLRKTRYRAAIVPHYSALKNPHYLALARQENCCLVNMLDDSLYPLEQIAQSECVISESLHGLIFAEAMQRPSVWISRNDNPMWNFKFEDWFSTTDNPQLRPIAVTATLAELLAKAERRYFTQNKQILVEAFPRHLQAEVDAKVVDFARCREESPLVVAFSHPALSKGMTAIAAEDLNAAALELRNKLALGRSELSYILLHAPEMAAPLGKESLQSMQVFMDENSKIDCLWLPYDALAVSASAGLRLSLSEGPLAEAQLPPGAVMIRPVGSIVAAPRFGLAIPPA
ncbi:polysaccharide pyruvyl transferase family protein [Muricoccus aerilatus]|uniref:polysaccharide pyruvyl transferase family protein n=1 Tax=Muricoccus aerilatus TaxID=452982 RepID=UPI0009FC502A|nr:polysaccharide pyruvyl transferase family protein [Roseomonas aerilata]